MEDVRNCCLHNGFFQITGHSVPIELQNKIMDWNKKFFDLSLEQKMEVNKGTPHQCRKPSEIHPELFRDIPIVDHNGEGIT